MTITGRPSLYSPDLAACICARIAEGESLRTICQDAGMPSAATVFKWLADDSKSAFVEQYARAREAQADAMAEDILDIADNAINDWMERKGQNATGYEVNGEHIQRSRLRVDARKWLASKMAPKKYGDKLDVAHTGKDGGAIQHSVKPDLSGLSDAELSLLETIAGKLAVPGSDPGGEGAA